MKTDLILKIKNVKQSTILGIALIISLLINLPRVLQLYNIIESLSQSFSSSTIKDIIIRVIFLFIFSWLILQFNANLKYKLFNFGKIPDTIIAIIINTILFLSIVFSFSFIHQKATNNAMNSLDKGMLYFVYFTVLIIVVFIARILRYQIIRQQDIIEKEILKRESLLNELSALKNQINPHFLFNSLNSLNSLIRENKEATTFVNKLSFMYRYILQSGQQDLITLKDELKFLRSYIFLIKTRYRNKFSIDIRIEEKHYNENIPMMALQLLVENAVKHNEISESNPLKVKVYIQENDLVIENKIKPRTTIVNSTGHGLANINKRYTLLKNEQITISNTNGIFKVKLPLN